MRTSVLGGGLALALLALVPAPAAALEWRGRLGLEYQRDDLWSAGAPSLASPQLELNLGLDAGGYLLSPATLTWSGGLLYRRLRNETFSTTTSRDVLEYRLRTAFFTDPRSPFSLTATALRTGDDVSLEGQSGSDRVRQTVYDTDAVLKKIGLPTLNLGYAYADTDRSGPVYGDASTALHTLRGSVSLSDEAFSYGARYLGTLATGTFATDNYDKHDVELEARAHLATDVNLDLTDSYSVRLPTTTSALNLRAERNDFRAFVTVRPMQDDWQRGGYAYTRSVQSAPTSDDIDVARHDLSYTQQRRLADEWRVNGTATLSYTDFRVGAAREEAAGETLSAVALWGHRFREKLLEVRAGPSVALLQLRDGDSRFGHGATAGVSLGEAGARTYRVGYELRYESELFGTEGWSVTQVLTASADAPIAAGRLRGLVSASSVRRESTFLGPGASRALNGSLEYQRRRYLLRLNASVSEGIVGAVDRLPTDGLFLPAPYDTHNYTVSVTGVVTLTRYLSATGLVRYTSSVIPDRPDRDESEARGTLDLRYGALTFSLEDRFVISEAPAGGTIRANEVFVRAARSFGSGVSR